MQQAMWCMLSGVQFYNPVSFASGKHLGLFCLLLLVYAVTFACQEMVFFVYCIEMQLEDAEMKKVTAKVYIYGSLLTGLMC